MSDHFANFLNQINKKDKLKQYLTVSFLKSVDEADVLNAVIDELYKAVFDTEFSEDISLQLKLYKLIRYHKTSQTKNIKQNTDKSI